jgi:hypothetical protein
MALLGIKMSVFCSLLSVWGIIMLAAMGGLLMIKSVAFAEDFEAETLEEMYEKYDKAVCPCPLSVTHPLTRCFITYFRLPAAGSRVAFTVRHCCSQRTSGT